MSDTIKRALAASMRMRRARADGGPATDDSDIQNYERMRDAVAQQPEDYQQHTHLGDKPTRPVSIDTGYGPMSLGNAPYDVAKPLGTLAQGAWMAKTAPLYATPLAPVAMAADTAEGISSAKRDIDEGNYGGAAFDAAMTAPALAGKVLMKAGRAAYDAVKPYAAPLAAGAVAVAAPQDAEASFIGPRAKTAYIDALNLAKKYVGDGMSDKDSWLFTGWGRDKAGNWKSEISDKDARINTDAWKQYQNYQPTRVGDVLDHPPLFDAYPTSYSMKLNDVRSADPNHMGTYDNGADSVHVNRKISDQDKFLDTLLHELQHRHDMRFEGAQPGASPDMFPDLASRYREELSHLNVADQIHKTMAETGASPWNAYTATRQSYGHEFPQELSFANFSKIDPNAIPQRQMDLIDLMRTVKSPFDQYQATVGEQMARLPGQRRGMDDLERRHDFPLEMPDGIVLPQWANPGSPNHGDAAWTRAKNKRADGGDVIADVHDDVQGLADGGSVVQLAKNLLKNLHPAGSGYVPVPGKPANVRLPGLGLVEARPIEPLTSAADSYMAKIGRPGEHHVGAYPDFDEEMARRYAEAFDNLGHRPNDPTVRRSYDALADETLAQYRALKDSGLDMRFLKPGEEDPYKQGLALTYADVVNNGKLHLFPTDAGFGTSDAFNPVDSPMLRRVGRIGDLDNATVNDAFRAVHDAYGHLAPGNPFFRAPGEERAFINHSKMYSPDALPAMASETRGQNSWVNYGPHAGTNRDANLADTIYADQKIDLMPDWATQVPDADPGKAEGGAIVKRALDALGFYSKGAEVARGLQQKAGSPESMLNALRKGGVKNTEIQNADFLNETKGVGKLSRDDAADLFEAKKPQLREYVGDGDHTDFEPKYDDKKYQMPGGMYYNERLLALPSRGMQITGHRVTGAFPMDFQTEDEARRYIAQFSPENLTNHSIGETLRPDLERYPLAYHQQVGWPNDFQSEHWPDHTNVLAHLRMTERKLPNDQFATHLEELQSDWAQKGREAGFKTSPEELARLKSEQERLLDVWGNNRTPENDAAFDRAYDAFDRARSNFGKVPSAPYVGNTNDWTDLALKRALTVAAQNESPNIALTPGAAQFDRWGRNDRAAGVQKFYDNTVQPKLTKMLGQPEMQELSTRQPSMQEIDQGRIDGPTAQVPVFALPEDTRDKILREGFPLFADGGGVDVPDAPDAPDAPAPDDPSLIDRAKSVISALNPISSAEASPFDAVGKVITGAVGKAAKVAAPAIRTAEPMLFDYSKLHEVPNVPQFDLPRYEPPRGVPERTEALADRKNINRVNKTVEAGIPMGGREWYNTEPLRHAFIGELGPDEGAKAYQSYLDMVAATSPRSNVGVNARNASYYYMLERNGFSPSKPLPQPYGHIAQNLHMQNFDNVVNNGGWPVMQNPKPASFAQNLAGNQTPVTVDTHNARLWGMVDSKGNPIDLPAKTEYGFMERLQQKQAAKMGLTPAQYQAAAWIGGGAETGLRSSADPFLKVFEDRVGLTSRALGLSKEAVLQRMIRGEIPLKSEGGDVEQEA